MKNFLSLLSDLCCFKELFGEKTMDTTVGTSNLDYLKAIDLGGTPLFEGKYSQFS